MNPADAMQYALTDEQRQLQDMLRRVAREKVAPRAHAIDRSGEYPQDMFDLLKSLGLFALPFPQEYGGTGSTFSACLARFRPRKTSGVPSRRSRRHPGSVCFTMTI